MKFSIVFNPKSKIDEIEKKLSEWSNKDPKYCQWGSWWGDAHMISTSDNVYRIWVVAENFSIKINFSNNYTRFATKRVWIEDGSKEEIEKALGFKL